MLPVPSRRAIAIRRFGSGEQVLPVKSMNLIRRLSITILLLLAAGLVVLMLRGAATRREDAAFHGNIPENLVVDSSAFRADTEIPTSFTCKGEGTSPDLKWSKVPVNAMSFVLIVDDWDVPLPWFRFASFTHWILYNIPATETELKRSINNDELRQAGVETGANSSDSTDYVPPCPPIGQHKYVFRVYALNVARIRPSATDRRAIFDAMRGHVVAYGELNGRVGS
jgi:Raf kinase inhibitor-like YbhB/YbcL family protein